MMNMKRKHFFNIFAFNLTTPFLSMNFAYGSEWKELLALSQQIQKATDTSEEDNHDRQMQTNYNRSVKESSKKHRLFFFQTFMEEFANNMQNKLKGYPKTYEHIFTDSKKQLAVVKELLKNNDNRNPEQFNREQFNRVSHNFILTLYLDSTSDQKLEEQIVSEINSFIEKLIQEYYRCFSNHTETDFDYLKHFICIFHQNEWVSLFLDKGDDSKLYDHLFESISTFHAFDNLYKEADFRNFLNAYKKEIKNHWKEAYPSYVIGRDQKNNKNDCFLKLYQLYYHVFSHIKPSFGWYLEHNKAGIPSFEDFKEIDLSDVNPVSTLQKNNPNQKKNRNTHHTKPQQSIQKKETVSTTIQSGNHQNTETFPLSYTSVEDPNENNGEWQAVSHRPNNKKSPEVQKKTKKPISKSQTKVGVNKISFGDLSPINLNRNQRDPQDLIQEIYIAYESPQRSFVPGLQDVPIQAILLPIQQENRKNLVEILKNPINHIVHHVAAFETQECILNSKGEVILNQDGKTATQSRFYTHVIIDGGSYFIPTKQLSKLLS